MQIPQNIIDEVVERSDIVDIIGKDVKLRKSGVNYFGCCPFHNEKTPSFSVNSVRQMYHCFGCGESGNVITFMMKHYGLDFIDSVKSLADKYGVKLPDEKKYTPQEVIIQQKQAAVKLSLEQTLAKVKTSYVANLTTNSGVMGYLQKRGVNPDMITTFELGYSVNDFQGLARLFDDYATNQNLIDSGLVAINDNAKRYDRFRHRLMFPILNQSGNLIGFGGRVVDNSEPKYLNSPETQLFDKSKELYGLYYAKTEIRKQNLVIVVEGYMDVIMCNQYGVTNTVASMGTALSKDNIASLFRMTDNVCYCFDGDNAGIKAAMRAMERSISLISENKMVKFLFLPDSHDPDSYLREYGADNFYQKIQNDTVGFFDMFFRYIGSGLNLSREEDKLKLVSLVKPYFQEITSSAINMTLKRRLATEVGYEYSLVENLLSGRNTNSWMYQKFQKFNSKKLEVIPSNMIENLLVNLMRKPRLAALANDIRIDTENEIKQNLLRYIRYIGLYYDEITDYQIDELLSLFVFDNINLRQLYNNTYAEYISYGAEKLSYMSDDDFIILLDKIFYPEKRRVLRLVRAPHS